MTQGLGLFTYWVTPVQSSTEIKAVIVNIYTKVSHFIYFTTLKPGIWVSRELSANLNRSQIQQAGQHGSVGDSYTVHLQ